MNRNQIMWVIVLVFVSVTLGVTLDGQHALSKGISSILPKATPPAAGDPYGKFGTADYESVEVIEPVEHERRKRINARYDGQGWVQKNPHPETGKIGRVSEEEPPPELPTEADVIAIGRVVGVTTHVSNDKGGVYSEFKIKVEQLMKNGASVEIDKGGLITANRAGGVVRYPNGQRVLYLDSKKGLPEVGREYLFFLNADRVSQSFPMLTGYEVQETVTVPLDHSRNAEDIKGLGKADLIKTVREKITRGGGVKRKP